MAWVGGEMGSRGQWGGWAGLGLRAAEGLEAVLRQDPELQILVGGTLNRISISTLSVPFRQRWAELPAWVLAPDAEPHRGRLGRGSQ